MEFTESYIIINNVVVSVVIIITIIIIQGSVLVSQKFEQYHPDLYDFVVGDFSLNDNRERIVA